MKEMDVGSSLNGARNASRVRSESITSSESSYFREPILHLHINRRCAKAGQRYRERSQIHARTLPR